MTPEDDVRGGAPPDPAAQRLRAALAGAALAITPGPVPLAAVEREGRRIKRRRTTAAALGAALVVAAVPLAIGRVTTADAPARVATPPASPTSHAPSRTPLPSVPVARAPRTVEPGQRVDAGRGWHVWLTERGKYWAGPDGQENFRSTVDGNLDMSVPGISHQSEGDATGTFHSGVYYGTKGAARVELAYPGGTVVPAELIELAGSPGWGAWYVFTPRRPAGGGDPSVRYYDGRGRLLSSLPGL
ncbi:hypothetical protein ABT160_33965 [Streptomyces sp. NPDC001941]|uniref:hypothetical protein n=1 Tax=Streptomyces sp. NPDC001941 TaxID=3154659 RepID=UPI003326EF3B